MRILLLLAAAVSCLAQKPPLTPLERFKWATNASVGPANIAGGAVTSAYSTWTNKPPEYGPHWDGWAKRQGLRLTGSLTSNFMEAGVGALWGEDPRYRRAGQGSIKKRAFYAIKTAFISYDRQGQPMPAYARYASVIGSNYLANTWRPDSQRTQADTWERIGYGFVGRISSNAFAEFWPDIRRLLRRH